MKSLGDVGAGHVLGRYELLMPIASGGMATVWAARLKGTRGFQKIVAIKTMLPSMTEDAEFEQMFLDEASLASRIRHPHVVEILDLGEENGVLYLVMEWVDGEPLSVLLKAAAKKGGIPLPVGVRIATHACAGLHAAHELRDDSGALVGLVHRDVSPQNVLVTFDGVVKVVDFGVAKAMGRVSAETNAGQIKGKAAYMSPEQARGGKIDRRTDVFAMGILLYQLTTGKHPFRGENDVATLYNITSDAPVFPPRRVVPGYPPALEVIVMQALAKDANKRYPTANDLLKALDQSLPKSIRMSTDEEVGGFVSALVPERREKRQEALKSSLKTADDRAAGRVVVARPISAEISQTSGFTPVSNVSGIKVPTGTGITGITSPDALLDAASGSITGPSFGSKSSTDVNGTATGTGTGRAKELSGVSSGASAPRGSVTPPPGASDVNELSVDFEEDKGKKRSSKVLAVSLTAVAAAAVVGIAAFMRSNNGRTGAASDGLANAVITVENTPAAKPAGSGEPGAAAAAQAGHGQGADIDDTANPSAGSEAGGLAAADGADAGMIPGVVPGIAPTRITGGVVGHKWGARPAGPNVAVAPVAAPVKPAKPEGPAAPAGASTTFVPPIRNPGF